MLTCDIAGPHVIAMPHLMADRRERMTVAPGTTVAEMVAAALPGLAESDRKNVRVTLGKHVVPEVNWARVKPKPAATVIIRVVPTGGSFRAILAIAVTVAAVALGQAYLAPFIASSLGFAAGSFGAIVTTSLVGAAAGAAAALAINALVSLKPPAGAGGVTALERAFTLARSGECASVPAIRRRLIREGYSATQIIGPTLSTQLRALFRAARRRDHT